MQSDQSLLNEFGFTFGVAECIAGFGAPVCPVWLKTVNCHVVTRSCHELAQAWAGQSQLNIGGLAGHT